MAQSSWGGTIGKMTTQGVLTEYPLPSDRPGFGAPDATAITAGPDGKMWFVQSDSAFGKITTSGVITQFAPLPYPEAPMYLTGGPDGNVWFTDIGSNSVG
jgi:virginiamycin B lyase